MIGDQSDVFGRLKAMLPSRWFGSTADSMPIIDAVLWGIAGGLSFVYALYQYAKLQTRINTASGGWLDMIAADFFGATLPRNPGQSDDSYRNAIKAQLLRARATRAAIYDTLTRLTLSNPTIIEPGQPQDTAGYGVPTSGYGSGFYGSLALPYQAFVIAYRPYSVQGIAFVAGYGISTGGYGQASQAEYADLAKLTGGITDADLYAAVAAVKAEGTVVWMAIENATKIENPLLLYDGQILDDGSNTYDGTPN